MKKNMSAQVNDILSDGFRGYAKLLRQSENLSKKTR